MANIHEHAVLSDVLVPKGSGFTAHHGDDFMMANNAQWIGFSLEIGPDGALYVLDWHDGDICGQDVLHQETGRIYRITSSESSPARFDGRYGDLRRMTDAQLVQLQTSGSDWHARRARVILQGRAAKKQVGPDTAQQLRALFTSSSPDTRLRAMWALHVIGGWTADALLRLLGDADPHVRAWAIQLLAEDKAPSQAALARFAQMAREDSSPVVRLYLASALQRMPGSARWPIARELMLRAEDADDHNLPKMIWLGVEPLVADGPSVALEHASGSRIPLVARFVARRAVDANALDPLVATLAKAPAAQVSLLEGMRDGLEGRVDLTAPQAWASVYDRLKRAPGPLSQLAADVAGRFGDTDTARQHLELVRNRSAAADQRRHALQSLAARRRPQLAAQLASLLDDPSLRLDAIRAVAAYDDEGLGRLLIERYPAFTAAEKAEAIQSLAARPRYGRMLTAAIAAGTVPKADVPVHSARQLLRVVGAKFVDVWGPVDRRAAEEKAYARYRGLLNDTAMAGADLQAGRDVYMRTCGACHRMHGEGGTIGPDLTGSNRTNLSYLLLNVLEPNAEVPDAYKMVVITTRDGRTYSGNVVGETDRQVTLRIVGRDNVPVNKADIQSREATAASMMPPGLFDALTDREVVDLVGYLQKSTGK
jgi:putative heme-binding domain-containing protein